MEATVMESQVSERVRAQKERLLRLKPTVCTERARIYTEVYRRSADQPLLVTRALALAETLRRMSIYIDEGELIVGNQASAPRAAPIFPEYAVGWILDELDEASLVAQRRLTIPFIRDALEMRARIKS